LSRPALYRIQTILASLINGEKVTTRVMAKRLEVSPRTVARDIDYLINSLHVPVSYDQRKHTYVLNGPVPVLFSAHAGAPSQTESGPDVEVILEIDADLTRHFEAVELHPSQRLERRHDGSGRLHLHVPANDVLVQWIMSYGGKIRVVAPQALRDRVHSLAMSLITKHRPVN
jgi:predicted DNA-binding transcriptional regulator YafY